MITFERATEGTYEVIVLHLQSGEISGAGAVGEIDLTKKIPTARFYASTIDVMWSPDDLMQIATHMVLLQREFENAS